MTDTLLTVGYACLALSTWATGQSILNWIDRRFPPKG